MNGTDTEFAVLEHDGLWVAIGEAPDLHITLDGEGVAFADLRLVSLRS